MMLRVVVLALSLLSAHLPAAAPPLAPAARPALAQSPCDWSGVWLPFEGEVRLVQDGASVTGSYFNGKGLLRGTVDGNVLRGEWKEAPSYSPPFNAGRFIFTMAADCSFYNGTNGFGDANCCNEWGASRDDEAPPSLAVTVDQGTLTVDGQTLGPGVTYFPPACPPDLARAGAACSDPLSVYMEMNARSKLKLRCFVRGALHVMAFIDRAGLREEEAELIFAIAQIQLAERCGINPGARQGDAALGLAIRQGEAAFTSAVDQQVLSLEAGPATAALDGAGSFIAGYSPGAGLATLRSNAAPLEVSPATGAPFTLPPYSRVAVTAAGAGPVTPLPRNYAPMQAR